MSRFALQPTDKNGRAVPVLGLGATVAVIVPEGSATSATPLPGGSMPGGVVRVAPTGPCHIAFGGSDVTVSTSSALLLSPEYFKILDGQTHFRVIGIESGLMTVSVAE